MRTIFTFLFIACTSLLVHAQTTTTFESLGLSQEEILNDSGVDGGFTVGNLFLPNSYDADFNFWSGWAISATSDNSTPGLSNQFSAMTGAGFDQSITYGVGYSFDGTIMQFNGAARGGIVEGLYVTNSAYPYFSMLDGDGFAKKFGGETGDDPDFFLLTIKKYFNGELSTDSVDFYLADYRFEDNSQDYIIDDWNYIDLSTLGNADSLLFLLSSSDSGMFGMNTPAYFCIDDITINELVSTNDIANVKPLSLYPNPVTTEFRVNLTDAIGQYELSIYDTFGRLVYQEEDRKLNHTISTTNLTDGTYYIQLLGDDVIYQGSFVKQ